MPKKSVNKSHLMALAILVITRFNGHEKTTLISLKDKGIHLFLISKLVYIVMRIGTYKYHTIIIVWMRGSNWYISNTLI